MAEHEHTSGLFSKLLTILIFLTGFGIYIYPTVSERWNQHRDEMLISRYEKSVEKITEEDYSDVLRAAREYNTGHSVNTFADVFSGDQAEEDQDLSYEALLNPLGNGVMGYMEIPKIGVRLAIYHGTGKDALERGSGHIEGTSLPIGGTGTHTALSAHRGLPGMKLFTDLDLLTEGDQFYIHVLGDTLAYEVDQIVTVLPYESDALALSEGEDLATLVTCTPYSVNTHRLLVRGHRVPYTEEAVAEHSDRSVTEQLKYSGMTERLLFIGMAAFLCIVLILAFVFRRKK